MNERLTDIERRLDAATKKLEIEVVGLKRDVLAHKHEVEALERRLKQAEAASLPAMHRPVAQSG